MMMFHLMPFGEEEKISNSSKDFKGQFKKEKKESYRNKSIAVNKYRFYLLVCFPLAMFFYVHSSKGNERRRNALFSSSIKDCCEKIARAEKHPVCKSFFKAS